MSEEEELCGKTLATMQTSRLPRTAASRLIGFMMAITKLGHIRAAHLFQSAFGRKMPNAAPKLGNCYQTKPCAPNGGRKLIVSNLTLLTQSVFSIALDQSQRKNFNG